MEVSSCRWIFHSSSLSASVHAVHFSEMVYSAKQWLEMNTFWGLEPTATRDYKDEFFAEFGKPICATPGVEYDKH